MINRLFKSPQLTKTTAAERAKPRCPTCHNTLQHPPSLTQLQTSPKATQIPLNTTLDRTLPLCKTCAYNSAHTSSTTMPSPLDIQALEKKQQQKILQAQDLIGSPDLSDQQKETLRAALPFLEGELAELAAFEGRIRAWQGVREENERVLRLRIELGGMGVEFGDDLGKVLRANLGRLEVVEDEVARKAWMGYWAVWGWDGEMDL